MRLSLSPRRRRRWAVALALSAGVGLLSPSVASAASPPAVRAAAPATARSAVGGSTTQAEWTWRRLNISMQAQQLSNWCWAASGDTVAEYYGYDYSQNQFCNLAFGRAVNSSCPNWQATLGNDQQAFDRMGINPGRYVNGYLNYDTITREIDADTPPGRPDAVPPPR
ncbi:papain-like cysteine protease family protein [Streptomyces sp. NPDC003781]|uniref:papain-like cysteine protease family protein n=1 Tax=Streptomyces sp. NPDC003781 TaxID=3364686 RepID=UPI00368658BF